jgi:putative IMPACT (imprinted ancient) family translation regulator
MSIPPTSSLFPIDYISCEFEHQVFWDIISDRWSKYTASWGKISAKEDIKPRLKKYLSDKYFTKATHNTYAYRISLDANTILEGKNDDWETWAWQCILRELQRKNFSNIIVVVTRYFGGTHLHADRFRNVIDSTKIFIEKSWL